MAKVYVVGSTLEGEALDLLHETMANLGVEYQLSSKPPYYEDMVRLEASKLKPPLILCLGTTALHVFAPEAEDKMSTARVSDFNFGDSLVRCTYSPNYVLKQGGMRSKAYIPFMQDIKNACEQVAGEHAQSVPVKLYSADEVLTFIRDYANEPTLGFDYEGSSLNALEDGYSVAGIGLATGDKAGYLWIEDYATVGARPSAEFIGKFKRMAQLLDTRRTLVFNANYETLVTTNVFGYRPRNLVDVMQNLKALDITGGLKDIAATRLGVRGWTRGIEDWLENLSVIVSVFKPTARAPKKEYLTLEAEGLEAAIQLIVNKNLKSRDKTDAAFRYILGQSEEIYGPDRAYHLLEAYLLYLGKTNDWEVRYNHIPKEIIGPYCGNDARYTYLLDQKYNPEIESRGLADAAKYYNQQMQFGIDAETSGFAWDDSVAARLETQYKADSVTALRNFLLSAPASNVLGHNNPVSMIEIRAANNIETLKKYFNPNNNQAENTALLSSILLQPNVRMAMLFREVSETAQNDGVEYAQDPYPLFYKLVSRFAPARKAGIAAQYVQSVSAAVHAAITSETLTTEERILLSKYGRYSLQDASSGTIEALASACAKFLGVDLDDPDTWTEEYKAVFYYKLFKKIDKVVSAFINGKNGRQMVQIVRHDEGKPFLTRVHDYRVIDDADIDVERVAAWIAQQPSVPEPEAE